MNTKTDSFGNSWPTDDFLSAVTHPVFRHILKTLLIVVDRNGHIVFSNHAFLSISGFSENELLGEHFCMLFLEEQRAPVKASFAEQIDTGEFSSDFVIPLRDSSGDTFYIHWNTSILTDSHGNVEYLVGSGVDSTEHRKTLRNFEESRKRFQNLVETTSDWVWETDAAQRFTYSNPQIQGLLGYRPEEIVGKTPFDFMPRSEVDRISKYFSTLEKTAPIDRVLNIKLHKDGHRVTMETSGVPFFSKKNELLGFRGITRDITERQNALEALQKSEERLRLSQQFSNVGNWEWNIATENLYWSEQIWTLFGHKINAFKLDFHTFMECVHPDDRETLSSALKNTLQHGTPYDEDYRVIWPNGETHWLRSTSNIDCDAHGKPIRMLGLVNNIDRRKHDEQEKTRQAKDQRNTLIREVHHRIKNNLQGITGLLRNTLNSKERDPRVAVEKAITQINAIALIHGIHGQQNERELLLCEMLPAIVDNHAIPGQSVTGIDLSVDIDCPLCLQDNEAVPIALILNELITNALKHARKKNAHDRVRISLSVLKGQGAIHIHCPGGNLPEGFDFQLGAQTGTGLELVRALLPPAGMSIKHQQTSSGVTTEVMLQAPIVRSISKQPHNSAST